MPIRWSKPTGVFSRLLAGGIPTVLTATDARFNSGRIGQPGPRPCRGGPTPDSSRENEVGRAESWSGQEPDSRACDRRQRILHVRAGAARAPRRTLSAGTDPGRAERLGCRRRDARSLYSPSFPTTLTGEKAYTISPPIRPCGKAMSARRRKDSRPCSPSRLRHQIPRG